MNKKYWMKPIFALLVVIIASCGTQLYMPGGNEERYLQQTEVDITLKELREGRVLYVNSCGGCHYLHYPQEFTIAEWKGIYPEMKTRVHLEETSLNKIYYYLIAGALDNQISKD